MNDDFVVAYIGSRVHVVTTHAVMIVCISMGADAVAFDAAVVGVIKSRTVIVGVTARPFFTDIVGEGDVGIVEIALIIVRTGKIVAVEQNIGIVYRSGRTIEITGTILVEVNVY